MDRDEQLAHLPIELDPYALNNSEFGGHLHMVGCSDHAGMGGGELLR